ncbi:hypothetical protein PFISCL1PPCAC_15146, partial [Pristionchus fissidentatus]
RISMDSSIALDSFDDISDQCCCTICSESYGSSKFIPRSLDCGHTFCEGCIYNDKLRINNKVKCPMCTRVTELPDSKKLSINYALLSLAEKLVKSRADPKIACSECTGKFSPQAVRLCMTDGCDMHNKLICLNCAVDIHGSHKLVKYDAKMEKIREELRVKITNLCQSMETKKLGVLKKTEQLARMAKALETRFSSVNIPPHIIGQLDTLAAEQDANEYMDIVNDLAETLMNGCNSLTEVLDNALKSATQQFDDLFEDEQIDDNETKKDAVPAN